VLSESDRLELTPVDRSPDRLRMNIELSRDLLDVEQACCIKSMHVCILCRPPDTTPVAGAKIAGVTVRREQLDDARLLPRFRDRAAMLAEQRAVLRKAVADAVDEGRSIEMPQTAAGDLRDLRGLPAVGVRGVGGVIPGTQPEAEAIRRSERGRGR
jgi:hypothetical protein